MKVAFLAKGDNWGEMPFFFNLTRPVGKGYPSASFDDVGFVQFCFAAIASSSAMPVPPNLKEPWSKVRVTGQMDDLTQAGIDAWQQDRRTRFGARIEVDGIFSVAPPSSTDYGKDAPYSIVGVNYILLLATPSVWPRLDMHPLAGPMAEPMRKALSVALTA